MLSKLEQTISNCSKCPRLRQVTPHPMPHIYYGDLKDVEIMCIARNPGLENDSSNVKSEDFMKFYKDKWWECRVGKYFRDVFGDEVLRTKVSFTNICKCSSPANSDLTNIELDACVPYLIDQINIVKPKVIFTFNTHAKNKLMGVNNTYAFYHPTVVCFYRPELKSIQKERILKLVYAKTSVRPPQNPV